MSTKSGKSSHPFVEGDKQAALMVMYVFLYINRHQLDAPEVEAADAMLRLASGELTGKDLSRWIKATPELSPGRDGPEEGPGRI